MPAIRPFWEAVLGYATSRAGADDELVDPARQGPTIWFQQMDEPRPQRNRIHFDITVPHDDAERARSRPRSPPAARWSATPTRRAFWVLADAEGNEACICSWESRDERWQEEG